MAFGGILEDSHLPHVPGTVILNEEAAHSESVTGGLRHGMGRNAGVVLAPQPSEDPNDPLNWSDTKKISIISILAFDVILYAGTVGPLLNAGLSTISHDFGVPIGDITVISGYQLLVAGAFGPLVCAFSRKYGKRPLFMLCSILGVVGTVIGSASNGLNALLTARVVQGFAISAYESLVITAIGDLFFVHERGLYSSIINFLLAGISNFSSVITVTIVSNLGWKYLFHILLAFVALQLILLILFCLETTYNRDKRYDTDEVANVDLEKLAEVEHRNDTELEKSASSATRAKPVPLPKTFRQELAILTGVYTDENLLQLVLGSFAVWTNFTAAWVIIAVGGSTVLSVAVAFVLAQIFTLPPYNLTAAGVGYLSLGPFVGSIIGSVIAWGYMAEQGINLYACATVHGIVLVGVVAICTAATAYALDAYRDMSNEIFIAIMLFKNVVLYRFSEFVNNWTAFAGPFVVYSVFGGIGLALTLAAIPVYIFGKQYRSLWARHNLLERMGVKTHAEV
ncbi:serine/threonine kinase 16 [Aureobasidium namibiae CBS 147.97]|uniref:Serine/threonine kinase 16 n=1 Tax=Aureobasidium namibiae CBS 147.97 TaxID=1043004 RepID=A0A074XHW8_9PEZI|nr:serine/threonine kinase 16 [Aureobasidium namibiae CBS 147.97]KEQ74156.1 serine/threonine kinase 16 [Aureobasidium namibiae CBS 147.97]